MPKNKRTFYVTIDMDVFKTLGDTFWSAKGGASYLLGHFHQTYRQRLFEIKGLFSQRELMLMIDALKNVDEFPEHIPCGRFFADTIRYQVEENRYAIKWDLDGDLLLQAIDGVGVEPYRIMCLAIWAFAATHGDHNKPKDEYIKELL